MKFYLGELVTFDASKLKESMRNVLRAVDNSNQFLKRHVPPLSKVLTRHTEQLEEVAICVPEV